MGAAVRRGALIGGVLLGLLVVGVVGGLSAVAPEERVSRVAPAPQDRIGPRGGEVREPGPHGSTPEDAPLEVAGLAEGGEGGAGRFRDGQQARGAGGEGEEDGVDTGIVPEVVRVVAFEGLNRLDGDEVTDPVGPLLAPGGAWVAWQQEGRPVDDERGARGPRLWVALVTGSDLGAPLAMPLPDAGPRGARDWRDPVWGPNGSLLFEATNAGGVSRIHVGVPGGGVMELVASVDQPGALSAPASLADGSWQAMVANTHGNGDIRLRDASSGAVVGLPVTDTDEDRPRFDASGAWLTYEREGREIGVASVASRKEVARVGQPGWRIARPELVGEHVVFFRSLDGGGNWALMRARRDGGEHRVLASGVRLPAQSGPAVSPDGAWVAVAWADLARTGLISLVHVETGQALDVQTGLQEVDEPSLAAREDRWLLAFVGRDESGRALRLGTLAPPRPQL